MKDTIKKWYNDEKFVMWYKNKQLIRNCVIKGTITEKDYEDITGEPF